MLAYGLCQCWSRRRPQSVCSLCILYLYFVILMRHFVASCIWVSLSLSHCSPAVRLAAAPTTSPSRCLSTLAANTKTFYDIILLLPGKKVNGFFSSLTHAGDNLHTTVNFAIDDPAAEAAAPFPTPLWICILVLKDLAQSPFGCRLSVLGFRLAAHMAHCGLLGEL